MIIGLTGKSCSGKNYVAQYMESLGWDVLDLDAVGHHLLEENSAYIKQVFGTSDRKELGRIVFNDKEKRTLLESILYPNIRNIIFRHGCENAFVVANGALLHRAGIDKICNVILYVDAPYEVRLRRALSRDNITEQDFKLRDSAQEDVHYDDVQYDSKLIIINNETDCTQQVKDICEKINLGQDIP